nr:MAG TPA: Helix-turn-helix XRE-family like protein [Caudoviricetes sp.]
MIKLILSNISKIRQEKGYSLRQLEYKTGISKSTIFRLENNQTKLYLELLEKISIALNCKIEDLYIKI